MIETARERARSIPGRGDKAYLRVVGLVTGYLTRWLPDPSATFIGAEQPVPNGRVDLVWSHVRVGVFYDEIKTWRHDRPDLDAETMSQVQRYLDAGLAQRRTPFAGVRLLTLGNPTRALWLHPDGQIETLQGTTLDLTGGEDLTTSEVW